MSREENLMSSVTSSCPARRLVGAVVLLVVGLVLLGGCAPGGQEDISGVFIGQPSGADELIAVIADAPETSGSERRVRAYICDGRPDGIAEWFTGQVAGNDIDLTSSVSGSNQSGTAQFQGTLGNETVTGTITHGDGSSYSFTAPAAIAGAGLYTVTNNPDEHFSGTSTSGETIEGFHTQEDSTRVIDNTITLNNGEQIHYTSEALFEGSGPPGTYFLIVAPNGEREYGKSVNLTSSGMLSSFGSMSYATQLR